MMNRKENPWALGWVTVAPNDFEAERAVSLAKSLKATATIGKLAVIITPKVGLKTRVLLEQHFDLVYNIDVKKAGDVDIELYAYLFCWNIPLFEKCVYLHSDNLVMRPADELFQFDELSAVREKHSDRFKSNMFVYEPSAYKFERLFNMAKSISNATAASYDCILYGHFHEWGLPRNVRKHLKAEYNETVPSKRLNRFINDRAIIIRVVTIAGNANNNGYKSGY